MFIPVSVIVGALSFVAGACTMFGLGLLAGKREKARLAMLLRETLPSGDEDYDDPSST